MANNFCIRPWTELHFEENGGITPCCVMPSNVYPIANGLTNYLQSDKLKEIKTALKNNERHPYCKACWETEDNGVRSHRLYREQVSDTIESIHIRYNNICNFKCRMCNPKFSSTWLQENKIHGYFEHEYTLDKDIFDVNSELLPFILANRKTLKKINISGGEPLIADANLYFLKWLCEHNLTDIMLNYSTNLSKIEHKGINLIDFLSKFKAVNLAVSVDGYGKAVEYSRHGFNWQNFVKNLEYARNNRLVSSLICVVNIYSIYTIPQLQRFCDNNNLSIIYQSCFSPQFLSVQSLPLSEKKKILKYYEKVFRKDYVKNQGKIKEQVLRYMMNEQLDTYVVDTALMKNYSYNSNKEFKRFNTILDKTRNEDFKQTFPELSRWYDSI